MLGAMEWDGDVVVIVPDAMETSCARAGVLGLSVAVAIAACLQACPEPCVRPAGGLALRRRPGTRGSPAERTAPRGQRAALDAAKVRASGERRSMNI